MDYKLSPKRSRARARYRRKQEKEWQSKNGPVVISNVNSDAIHIPHNEITDNGERNGS